MTDQELNVRIAQEIMDLVPCESESHKNGRAPWPCFAQRDSADRGGELSDYAGNIEEAFGVVRRMREMEANHSLSLEVGPDGRAGAAFSPPQNPMTWSESISRAICQAALESVARRQP